MEITPNGLSIITSEALYCIKNNVKSNKFVGNIDVDARALSDTYRNYDTDSNSMNVFNICVDVTPSELKLNFDDFSDQIITPMAMRIVEKLNSLNGKYVSPMTLNFSDEDTMSIKLCNNEISIDVSYGYDQDTRRNILSIWTMVIQKSIPKVFLGGTCNGSLWRDSLQDKLKINSFNPVVEDWTEECMAEEIKQREECDFCLYVITPRMTGTYSIAEAVDDSNKRPEKTIFCFVQYDESFGNNNDQITLEDHVFKSLRQVGKMVEKNGGKYFTSLNEVVEYLNASA